MAIYRIKTLEGVSISFSTIGTNCIIHTFVVPYTKRRKGIGSKVLNRFVQDIFNKGFLSVELKAHPLTTDIEYLDVKKFYVKNGFLNTSSNHFVKRPNNVYHE